MATVRGKGNGLKKDRQPVDEEGNRSIYWNFFALPLEKSLPDYLFK